jgi:hypothetical protein
MHNVLSGPSLAFAPVDSSPEQLHLMLSVFRGATLNLACNTHGIATTTQG